MKSDNLKRGDVVEVHWTDAAIDDKVPFQDLDQKQGPGPEVSWGVVLSAWGRCLALLQTLSADTPRANGNVILWIPHGTIDKVVRLGYHDIPKLEASR